ncbi:hypothetical protein E9840_01705 [Tissierella creatinini]|nr:hypothetical protein E9840_01705 [Tissierella creatinini]TJX66485.1 hypothetical protein E8P77_07500 [Soehngenia saccharolytica]
MKRILIFTLLFVLISGSIPALAALPEDNIALHVASPLILHGEEVFPLDSGNPNVVPVIHKDRTLVPLRAISEHFGAKVHYDGIKREAVINYKDKTYYFPINKNYYRVEESGKENVLTSFDTETLIMEDRTMVPLRVISENILNKKVGYKDRVITIGTEDIGLDNKRLDEIKTKIGQALQVTSKSELKNIINKLKTNDMVRDEDMQAPAPSGMGEGPVMEAAGDKGASGSNDFSTTNEQVEGVNEADIIKTDGEFIYVANGKSVKIYRANNGKPVLVHEISMNVNEKTGEYIQFTEMYVDEDRLIVLGSKNAFNNWIRPIPDIGPNMEPAIDSRMGILPMGNNYTYAGVYSIDSNGKASLLKEVEIEGDMLSSRKKDDVVYLMVNRHMNYYGIDDGIVPMYRDSTRGNELRELSIDKIMYYPGRYHQNYFIVAALDTRSESTPTNIEAFLGSGNVAYMSNNALYIAGQDYNTIWGTITNISKFTIDGLKIGFAGGGMVEGSILNQFSMDEYNGNLRIATTNWQRDSINSLYILDKNLNEIGALKNLAPGETIYSTRFMGDMGYIVTFRQIDPLFVIDLSNPSSPKVVGELKIPGFSNYLHPISEDVLLGIGQNIDEKTGRQDGIKLSLFDVSNNSRPKEINNLVLGSSGSYAEVLNNHKALMLNLDKDMIAFTAQLSSLSGDFEKGYFNGGLILEVKEDGSMKLLQKIPSGGLYPTYVNRIIYIGDVLYYVQDDSIKAFSMKDFQEIKR